MNEFFYFVVVVQVKKVDIGWRFGNIECSGIGSYVCYYLVLCIYINCFWKCLFIFLVNGIGVIFWVWVNCLVDQVQFVY